MRILESLKLEPIQIGAPRRSQGQLMWLWSSASMLRFSMQSSNIWAWARRNGAPLREREGCSSRPSRDSCEDGRGMPVRDTAHQLHAWDNGLQSYIACMLSPVDLPPHAESLELSTGEGPTHETLQCPVCENVITFLHSEAHDACIPSVNTLPCTSVIHLLSIHTPDNCRPRRCDICRPCNDNDTG